MPGHEVFGILSHELRAPLQAMVMWLDVLKNASDGQVRSRAISALEGSLRTQTELVDDLLDASQIIPAKLASVPEKADVSGRLRSILEEILPEAERRGISLRTQLSSSPLLVPGHGSRLGQAFRNLIKNALRFTPDGGCIEVSARKAGPQVEIVISDNGNGITADNLQNLFSRQQRASSSQHKGLGLIIAKDVVDAHSGTIEVESEGPGTGTTFRIRLPRSSSDNGQRGIDEESRFEQESEFATTHRRTEEDRRSSAPELQAQALVEHQGRKKAFELARVNERLT
jgi:two-component system CheB/CheR fusion protein